MSSACQIACCGLGLQLAILCLGFGPCFFFDFVKKGYELHFNFLSALEMGTTCLEFILYCCFCVKVCFTLVSRFHLHFWGLGLTIYLRVFHYI
jgi:hypothetical protein